MSDDGEPVVAAQDRLHGLAEEAMVVGDEHAYLRHRLPPPPSRYLMVPCYARLVKGDEARQRIQKLLVTGDNRLKQGVDPEKARESWEQALAVAREAGLEEAIRPLVEIRLADLPRRS